MPVKYSQRKSAREQRKLAGESRKSAIENVKVTVPERSLFPVDFSETCLQPQNLTITYTKKLRSRVLIIFVGQKTFEKNMGRSL